MLNHLTTTSFYVVTEYARKCTKKKKKKTRCVCIFIVFVRHRCASVDYTTRYWILCTINIHRANKVNKLQVEIYAHKSKQRLGEHSFLSHIVIYLESKFSAH